MGLLARLARGNTEPEPARMVGADRNDEPSAREALRQHLREEADIRDRLGQVASVTERAADAAAREAAAQEALDQINELEAGDWQRYASTGTGSLPSPRTAERQDAAERLSAARREREETARSSAAAAASARELNDQYQQLAARRSDVVAAVLLKEAEVLAARYASLIEQSLHCERALAALRESLYHLGCGNGAERVSRLMRTGPSPNRIDDQDMRLAFDQALVATQKRWVSLSERLLADPNATAELPA
jgi:hypothetical protein